MLLGFLVNFQYSYTEVSKHKSVSPHLLLPGLGTTRAIDMTFLMAYFYLFIGVIILYCNMSQDKTKTPI